MAMQPGVGRRSGWRWLFIILAILITAWVILWWLIPAWSPPTGKAGASAQHIVRVKSTPVRDHRAGVLHLPFSGKNHKLTFGFPGRRVE